MEGMGCCGECLDRGYFGRGRHEDSEAQSLGELVPDVVPFVVRHPTGRSRLNRKASYSRDCPIQTLYSRASELSREASLEK